MTKGVMGRKQNIMGEVSDLVFGAGASKSQQAFALSAAGIGRPTEDIFGMLEAQQFQGPRVKGELPGMPTGVEMQNRVAEATVAQKAFAEGLGLMAKDTEAVRSGMQELTKELRAAAQAARDFADVGISRENR
jgi:ketosteroid isomerase-like protein